MSRFPALFDAFTTAHQPTPADLQSALQALPPAGQLPSPWETWTLIGLVRHRHRQAWVLDIMTSRLQGNPANIALLGSLGHPPDVPQSGPVPDLPEWKYYYHGRGCCLTHKVSGERIDVDFYDESADYFDAWFYINFIESLHAPEPTEWRIQELHPSFRTINLSFADLREADMLVSFPDGGAARLDDAVLRHQESIAAFCEAWEEGPPAQRLWLAALIGDWPAAHDAAILVGNPTIVAMTFDRVEKCRALREEHLRHDFSDERHTADVLVALADIDAQSLSDELHRALDNPLSGLTSAALEVIGERNDASWSPAIRRLFHRIRPGGQIPSPHIWMASLKLLLRFGHRDEALEALPSAGGTEIGEAVLLSLEHAPAFALPLIRKALCSGIPANRSEVAAILALIDRPWSRRELLAALHASDDQELTADSRAALLECRDPEGHDAVKAWEARNPHEPEVGTFLEVEGRKVGPFVSMTEVSLQSRARWVRYEMEKLHDRVMKVRNVEPPEPSRPWWKLW